MARQGLDTAAQRELRRLPLGAAWLVQWALAALLWAMLAGVGLWIAGVFR